MKTIFPSAILLLLLLLTGCAGLSGNATRLVDEGNGICRDSETGLMWQQEISEVEYDNLEAARDYVQKLNLGGYSDWRLPTIFELYELHFIFDSHKKSDCSLALAGNFWSDEKDGEGMVGAWEIGNQCDPDKEYFPGTKGRVRAVRP